MLQQVRQRLDEREPAADRDHVPERQDQRGVADAELVALADPLPVTRGEPVDVASVAGMNRTGRRGTVPALDELADEPVDAHHRRTARARSAGAATVRSTSAMNRRDQGRGVHERGVQREHTRDAAAPRHPRRDEGEVEELTVLVDDVGTDLVEQPPQRAERSGARHERERVVEGEVRPV